MMFSHTVDPPHISPCEPVDLLWCFFVRVFVVVFFAYPNILYPNDGLVIIIFIGHIIW